MRFFFHYNKPASKKAGKPQISVHYGGGCYIVDNVDVRVKTKGRVRKRQPYFVMVGDAEHLTYHDGTLVIEGESPE